MKKITTIILALAMLVSAGIYAASAQAQETGRQMVYKSGSQSSLKGSSDFFTGDVRIDPLFSANETAHFSGAYVTFEPGARSFWHLHPAGQHLVVVSGAGRTGVWEGPVEETKAGDVVWCPPMVKHFHGASPTTAMTHMALTGTLDGKNVEWMEEVTDAQYNAQ